MRLNIASQFLSMRHAPQWLKAAGLALVFSLGACGFQMRGVTPLPFDTLYVGIPDNSRFGADVRRAIRAASPKTQLVTDIKQASAILQQVSNQRTLRDVALNAQGRVEQYELGILFSFRLIDTKGHAIIPDTTFTIYREMPYDDNVVQAKQSQIETLYNAMQQVLVGRLVRRLTAPDVATAMAEIRNNPNAVLEEAPLYTPAPIDNPRDQPAPWQTPSITPGLGVSPR